MQFKDETVIVTGAGSGIGRAIAARCAADGALVIVTDVNVEGGEETVSQIKSDDGLATFRELNVCDREAFVNLIDETATKHGLDVLVNNAGIGQALTPVEETDMETFNRILDVNVRGVWNGCVAALPIMKERGAGVIVNIASVAGMIGSPRQAVYSLSKGGVLNFTRAVAAEVGRHGIRVNAVCPGVTETQLVRDDFGSIGDWDDIKDDIAENNPLGRLGRPKDVANCVAFLASDEAAFVTGHGLVVDGGYSCA